MFNGKVIETYTEDIYLTNNAPDMAKVNPILLSAHEFTYYSVGKRIGKAWGIGKSVASKSHGLPRILGSSRK